MIRTLYRALVESIDLAGKDGRASFAKLVIVAILVHTFVSPEPMPTLLAALVICAAFGRPMLREFLGRSNINLSESRSVQITATLDNRFTDDER